MTNKDISVAIVGAGTMAREHIRAFSSLEGVKVCGIFSRTKARAAALAQEFAIPLVAESMDALYNQTHADLVVQTVPELMAKTVATAALGHPWAVLLEKPAGYDLADAQAIADLAANHAEPVMVGLNRRFYSSTLAIKADLDTRPHESRFIHVQDQQSYAEARRYNHPEQVVEKFMYANSIHLIDMLNALGRGAVRSVNRITTWLGEHTRTMLAYIEFDSGDTGLYEGIWHGPTHAAGPCNRWSRLCTKMPETVAARL